MVGVRGYAGTGKTTMLGRARALAEKTGYHTIGLAPSASASAARTLGDEAGIDRKLCSVSSLATAAWRKAVSAARASVNSAPPSERPWQLDAVDAGKPFAQLQRAGMTTAVMDEILRQKDPELLEAVEASLAGDVKGTFEKLGDRVAEVNPDNLAGAAAARWLRLSEYEREATGLMAPSHELRREINGHVRERLARDGERLVSLGYTNAEKTIAANYAPGDIVAFHRDYRSLGVEKGEERRIARVDNEVGTVFLEGPKGEEVSWRPRMVGAKRGAVEVYRAEGIELRAGDRIHWTRNHAGLGLMNSGTAEVASVQGGRWISGSAIPSSAISITPGRRPCTGSRGAPSTTWSR